MVANREEKGRLRSKRFAQLINDNVRIRTEGERPRRLFLQPKREGNAQGIFFKPGKYLAFSREPIVHIMPVSGASLKKNLVGAQFDISRDPISS